MKRIGDILTRHKTPVVVKDDVTYNQVTIRTNYKGVVLRGTQAGATIGTKNQWRVSADQFILSRIDARNGAFGIIPEELEGAIVTNDFLAFDINENEVEREFFNVFLQSPVFLDACIKASRGNTNRKRVDEDFFLNFKVNLPSLTEQHELIKRIHKSRASVVSAQYQITHQHALVTKLKQAILQEAISGQLTADWRAAHSDAEPASQLLKRIQAEKARLIAKKKIRPEKPIIKIRDDEFPFELPTGWVWCRLGSLFEIVRGSSPRPKSDPKYFSKTRTPYHWIKISDFTPFGADGLLRDTAEFLTEEGIKHSRLVGPRDIIIACSGVGSVGKSLQLSISGYIYDGLLAIREIKNPTIKNFLGLYIRFKEITIYSVASGANWLNINTDILTNYIVPLPPLAEQAAIVERVESLMEHCRALEAEIAHTRTHAAHLLQAVLKEAFAPAAS